MALVVEDGSLVANANSFVSRAEVISYASARGITLPDTDATDVLAIKAMDYFWTLCFKGDLVAGYSTPFPRSGLVDGDTAEGYEYSIPHGIKQAQLQLSLDVHNGVDLTPSGVTSSMLKKSKVGPIEREFFAPGDANAEAPLTVANAWLDPFLCSTGMRLSILRA